MDARNKLIAETGLLETKIILGWLLNFRTMTISLPENKFIAYSRTISEMIERGWTSKAELESNMGRWTHLGNVVPHIFHFLSRLRLLLRRLQNKRQLSINEQCIADLKFLLSVLEKCREFDCLPSPDPRLSLRFMPRRSRQIQRRGICVEILSPIGTTIPRIQQPPRTHRGHNHNVGGHSSRPFETWRLCPFNDRQHNIGRMAPEIKFHGGW
jgi:hypothetical protein